MVGVYIHIPFCAKKCAYCDFLSFERNENFEIYTHALIEEVKTARLPSGGVDTIYIGGGTPTALPSPLLCEVLRTVSESFPLMPDAEITVEANPGTLSAEYLEALKAHGANRLSIGLQTTHPHLLGVLGRIHTMKEFTENFRAARKAGFDNVNVDLMFALPGQTSAEWRETLEEIIALSPEHISAYSLTPAESTLLFVQIENGDVILPDDKTDRDMYHTACRVLAEAGYNHYEISNFAKPKRESRHNINCWTMKPYIGFGLGAHSFDGQARWHNPEDMATYLSNPKCQSFLERGFSLEVLASETMFLGLRLMRGICESEFAAAFGKAPTEMYKNEITQLIKDGLLTRRQSRLFLTSRGMDLANRVFSAFIPLEA